MRTTVISLVFVVTAIAATCGCARRMTVTTGTTIGLSATPGDGRSQSPQVTLAYKRAEMAIVPTGGRAASKTPDVDCYSALAIVDFRTKWFSGTALDQFIATGHAARDIQMQRGAATQNEFTSQLVSYASGGTGKVLRDWINAAENREERKRRQAAITEWIGSNATYDFADLLTHQDLEGERQRFLREKGGDLNIPTR